MYMPITFNYFSSKLAYYHNRCLQTVDNMYFMYVLKEFVALIIPFAHVFMNYETIFTIQPSNEM